MEPSADQLEQVGAVAETMADVSGTVVLSFPDGLQVALPTPLAELLRASARELADGNSVTVLPLRGSADGD